MKISPAAVSTLTNIERLWTHRQWTIHEVGFTSFTFRVVSSTKVRKPKLRVHERVADEKSPRNKNIRLDTEDYAACLMSMTSMEKIIYHPLIEATTYRIGWVRGEWAREDVTHGIQGQQRPSRNETTRKSNCVSERHMTYCAASGKPAFIAHCGETQWQDSISKG